MSNPEEPSYLNWSSAKAVEPEPATPEPATPEPVDEASVEPPSVPDEYMPPTSDGTESATAVQGLIDALAPDELTDWLAPEPIATAPIVDETVVERDEPPPRSEVL